MGVPEQEQETSPLQPELITNQLPKRISILFAEVRSELWQRSFDTSTNNGVMNEFEKWLQTAEDQNAMRILYRFESDPLPSPAINIFDGTDDPEFPQGLSLSLDLSQNSSPQNGQPVQVQILRSLRENAEDTELSEQDFQINAQLKKGQSLFIANTMPRDLFVREDDAISFLGTSLEILTSEDFLARETLFIIFIHGHSK